MKKLTLLLLLSLYTHNPIVCTPIKLESTASVDGFFVNADTIEMLHVFVTKIKGFTKKYASHESEGNTHLLAQANAELIRMAHQFFGHAMSSKAVIVKMVEEDCKKRNPNSILMSWIQAAPGTEEALFEKFITNFRNLLDFCHDLVNFVEDFIHSCPKAQKQLKARIEKWHAFKEVLPHVIKKHPDTLTNATEEAFVKYVRKNHIDTMQIKDITVENIAKILCTYLTKTK